MEHQKTQHIMFDVILNIIIIIQSWYKLMYIDCSLSSKWK